MDGGGDHTHNDEVRELAGDRALVRTASRGTRRFTSHGQRFRMHVRSPSMQDACLQRQPIPGRPRSRGHAARGAATSGASYWVR